MKSYRVVAVVAGNSEAVILGGLVPDTQYQLTVAAIWSGRKYRSRAIVFRTLGKRSYPTQSIETKLKELEFFITESPRTSPQQDYPMEGVNGPPLPPFTNPHFKDGNNSANSTTRELPTVSSTNVLPFQRSF